MSEESKKLSARVDGYFSGREKNSAYGLVLLDRCINRFADHGDWDALARFYMASLKTGQSTPIRRVIRAAFGDHVTFAKDSKHDAGGKFTKVNWPGDGKTFPLGQSNAYSVVRSAIQANLGWDSKVFIKKLDEVLDKPLPKPKTVSPETQTKEAKALAKKLGDLRKAGFDLAALVREAQAMLAK